MSEEIKVREFPIQKLPRSCTMVVIGPPGAGKSSWLEYLFWANKHKYPCLRVWCGTEDTQGRYKKFTPELFITNDYVESEHEKSIIRQRTSIAEKCQNSSCIYLLDDCGTERRNFNSKLMKGQFKNGSQWWDCLFIISNQYVFDIPPDIRKSVSYVVLFREPSPDERQKLYKTFSIGCTFSEFNDLMDQITGDYTCLIFQKRGQSNNLEDCVYYSHVPDISKKKWAFGCEEYKKWSKDRYNPKYVESFI